MTRFPLVNQFQASVLLVKCFHVTEADAQQNLSCTPTWSLMLAKERLKQITDRAWQILAAQEYHHGSLFVDLELRPVQESNLRPTA